MSKKRYYYQCPVCGWSINTIAPSVITCKHGRENLPESRRVLCVEVEDLQESLDA